MLVVSAHPLTRAGILQRPQDKGFLNQSQIQTRIFRPTGLRAGQSPDWHMVGAKPDTRPGVET